MDRTKWEKFLTVEFKINDKNVGTVINYNYILNKIGDSPFKIIAGDDLISHNNIIESAEKLEKHTFFMIKTNIDYSWNYWGFSCNQSDFINFS